jgi:hypothetical protein
MKSQGNLTPHDVLIHCFSGIETDFARQLVAGLRGNNDSRLAEGLVEFAGNDAERRALLASVIGMAARQLLPHDMPPSEGPGAVAWQELLKAAALLYGTAVQPLGRLPFMTDRLLERLVSEGHRQRPESYEAGTRTTGPAGDLLAGLAVSRQLREAVSSSLGIPVAPTYDALYEYDPRGSHVRPHLDAPAYEFTVHLLLEHQSADPDAGSVLVVYEPGGTTPRRLTIRTGESVVLAGRGTIHSWAPLDADESRILTAIGFKRV